MRCHSYRAIKYLHMSRLGLALTLMLICSVLAAAPKEQAIQLVGHTDVIIPSAQLHQSSFNGFLMQASVAPKHIRLLKFKLSKEAFKQLQHRVQLLSAKPQLVKFDDGMDNKRVDRRRRRKEPVVHAQQLGMNDVPVLDQGRHGSCATFANVGAIDALFSLHQEEAMSPLCQLQLSRSLEPDSEYGDWEGADARIVQQVIVAHGFMHKAYQHAAGCGDLKHYPVTTSNDIGQAMPTALFEQNSDRRFSDSNRQPLFQMADGVVPSGSWLLVKKAIEQGHRVVIGSFIDPNIGYYNGIAGKHTGNADTWMMSNDLMDDFISGRIYDYINGHALIITGFDDQACATAADGQQQCGLFTLRNSWGEAAGDGGNFYMSYDYFQIMVMEGTALKTA